MLRKLFLAVSVVTVLALWACETTRRQATVTPQPPVIVDPPTRKRVFRLENFCQDGFCYWYDPARGQWYYLDGSGARVYIEGNPPGFDPGPYWPSEATLGSLQGYSRADYGLVPDTEGKVAPLM